MRALLLLIAVISGVAILAWIGGSMLPVAHQATRSATFAVAPDVLYHVISERAAYQEWWDDDTPTIVVESRPPAWMVTRINDGLPFGGTWTFEIVADADGSRLTITERGEVYNPIFRILSRYVFGHTATMDAFLEALAARVAAPG